MQFYSQTNLFLDKAQATKRRKHYVRSTATMSKNKLGRLYAFFIVFAAITFGFQGPSSAQEKVPVPVPPPEDSADPYNFSRFNGGVDAPQDEYYDIYARTFGYAQSRKELQEKLESRRIDYNAPMKQARENHARAVDQRYTEEKNKPISLSATKEVYGPPAPGTLGEN